MYKIIFDKDELFTLTTENLNWDLDILREVNLFNLICGIILDIIFMPIHLIMAIKIIKE